MQDDCSCVSAVKYIKYPDVVFLTIDAEYSYYASKYQVTSMPTFIAFRSMNRIDICQEADEKILQNMITRCIGDNGLATDEGSEVPGSYTTRQKRIIFQI